MILFAPNRFTNVFKTRFLQKFGQFSFGIYLMHPYGLALTFDYLPKANSGFEQIILCLFFSYCFGKCFYYVIEYPLVKMAKFLCNQISQAANKLPR
jgi:peptidoglycan/LPS O-acetylase OafA/YrhL